MAVFVLDKRKKALMPCSEKRARMLLERGGARFGRMVPFTIPLVDCRVEDSTLQPLRLNLDSGSKATGMALEKETVDASTSEIVRAIPLHMLLEWQHRGEAIWDALARRRAFRRRWRGNLRYRPSRFDNQSKPKGWLALSLRHRVDTVLGWVTRIGRLRPITALSQKLMRFDTQALEHPEISGTEQQQGSLFGYEVGEYLLEKWGRKCAYCDATGLPLEIDHIHPRSKGGSDRLSNLTIRASGSFDLQTGNGLVQGKASTDSLPWSGVKMDRVFVDQDSIGQRRLRELGRLTPPRYPSGMNAGVSRATG